MKTVCPSCGAIHSIEALFTDATARQCMRIVADLPQAISKRCLHYLAFFRPLSGRGLQWKKVLRLLTELQDLIRSETIQHGRDVARPCTPELWGQALEKMIENPPSRLPLKSHGYLKSVVWDLANDVDRKKEQTHNKAIRNGFARADRPQGKPTKISKEEMERIRKKNLRR